MSLIKEDSWLNSVGDVAQTTSGKDLIGVSEEDAAAIEKQATQEAEKVVRPIGELIEDYVHLRDTLKEERRLFKEREVEIKGSLEVIEASILETQRKLGITSLSTGGFTAFQTNKTSVRMSDWDTFSQWVLDTGNIQCVEKRPAKIACMEILEEFNHENKENEESGEPPVHKDLATIGLDKIDEIVVQVRRK